MRCNRLMGAVLAVAVCLPAAACSVPDGSGAGSFSSACAGPHIQTEPRQAQPGQAVTVTGEYYLDACYDTGQGEQAQAVKGLAVTFEQGQAHTDMGRLDATGSDGAVRTTITVPADAQPGLAQVTVGSAEPALVLIGDGSGGYPPWPGPPTGPFPLSVALTQMPTFPEGGWVSATATTEDFRISEKRMSALAPLGAEQVTFQALLPSYWMVDVGVHRCATAGCPAPVEPHDGPGCAMEVRVLDGPARMIYENLAGTATGCALRGAP